MEKQEWNRNRELWVLLHLREALGDPAGKLMQDELVERARNAWADAQRYRWLSAHARSTAEHWGGRWSLVIDGPARAAVRGAPDALVRDVIDACCTV